MSWKGKTLQNPMMMMNVAFGSAMLKMCVAVPSFIAPRSLPAGDFVCQSLDWYPFHQTSLLEFGAYVYVTKARHQAISKWIDYCAIKEHKFWGIN